jgi:esterase/lipase superfamily enzyme
MSEASFFMIHRHKLIAWLNARSFVSYSLVSRTLISCTTFIVFLCATVPPSLAQPAPVDGPTYKPSNADINVYYATTRLNESRGGRPIYGGARHLDFGEGSTEFGTAGIARPEGYQSISTAPSWVELRMQMTAADNYFASAPIRQMTKESQSDFLNRIQNFHGLIIIYVHGYDMPFDSAVREMAELIQEFQARSPGQAVLPIAFSWPSPGNKAAYSGDEASLEWSEKPFRDLVNQINKTKSDDTSLDLLAHSMGSRYAFAFARSQIQSQENHEPPAPIFRNLYLSCSDVDYHTAEARREGLQNCVSKLVYIMVNDNDGALFTSQLLHGAPRLGRPIDPGDDSSTAANIAATPSASPLATTGNGLLAQAENMLGDKAVALFGQKARNFVDELTTGAHTVFTKPSQVSPAQSPDVTMWLARDPYLSRDFGPKTRLIDSTGFITLNMGHRLAWPLMAGLMLDPPQDAPFVFATINKRPDLAMLKVMGGSPTYLYRFDRIDLSRLFR